MSNKPLTVLILGLQGAGKSSFVNSIAKRRILESGPNKTTKKITIIGGEIPQGFHDLDIIQINCDLASDDAVSMTLIEFPGLEHIIPDTLRRIIRYSDIVYWMSDIKTTFSLNVEYNLFFEIRSLIDNLNNEGHFIEMRYMATKYASCSVSKSVDSLDSNLHVEDDNNDVEDIQEIEDTVTESEDLETNFKNASAEISPTPVMKFNAFGRILSDSTVSSKLRDFLKKLDTNPGNKNTIFNLGSHLEFYQKKQTRISGYLIENFTIMKDHVNSLDDSVMNEVVECMNQLTSETEIEKIYQFLINFNYTQPVMTEFCVRYFIMSEKNIFDALKSKVSISIRSCFLLGLDKLSCLRKLIESRFSSDMKTTYDVIVPTDGKPEKASNNYIIREFCGFVLNQTVRKNQLELFTEFHRLETCNDLSQFMTKSFLSDVENLRKKLYIIDEIDVRMMIMSSFQYDIFFFDKDVKVEW